MTDLILQSIQDSPHSAILPIFEEALRSGQHISIEGGAVPIALDASGEIYHGAFDKLMYRTTGNLLRQEGYKVDATAFELSVRLAHYAQANGCESSLSLAIWDTDGVPLDQRKIVANRLVSNCDLESLPLAYREVAIEVLGSKEKAANLLAQIRILPQTEYEHSLTNRWRDTKRKIKKSNNVEFWAREHFGKTGQIFLVANEHDLPLTFLSTAQTRQPFDLKDARRASDRVRSEGALPITMGEQTLCGPIAGGRIHEMRKNARAKSTTANQNGVFTINIQDLGIEGEGTQKIARGVFFQNLGVGGDVDQHAAYVFSAKSSTLGQVIHLPRVKENTTFDDALAVTRTRCITAMELDDVTLYGTEEKGATRPVDEDFRKKLARTRFAWNR